MTTITDLSDLLDCPVFRPGHPGFAEEVAGFNLASTHTPDLVVAATSAEHVTAAVGWAAERGLPIAVQATGHGASSPIEGGLFVSTRRMNRVAVDPASRTATVGAGARWADVLRAAAPYGLAGLNGSSTDVGVVGYTLGGGLPVFGRAFGWAADQVHRIDVVTADGTLRSTDADHEPELFWALRGGKGNVGIVTSMTFGLLPLARFYGGAILFPGEHAAELVPAYARWAATVPDTMTTALQLLRVPPLPDVPEPLRGRFVVQLSVAHPGSAEEGARLVAPMRQVAPAIMDDVLERPYSEVDRVFNDPSHPVPAEEGSLLLGQLSEEALDDLLEVAGPGVDTPLLFVMLRQMGGALSRPAVTEDAICGRDAFFLMQSVGILAGPHGAAVPAATVAAASTMTPHSLGRTFLNMHGRPGDDADRARPWTPEVHERLRRAKGRFDPDNLFRYGHAVRPA
jgi:FAD/FMN-containing dehydrogenase